MERTTIQYTEDEFEVYNNDIQCVLLQIKGNELKKKSIIYDNQRLCASSIVKGLSDRKIINIMIVALTQSGKTGTMCGLLKEYLSNPVNVIPIENIYIITGLSSCEWVDQTKERMPQMIQERVYHRDKLSRNFVLDIINKKNVLILLDEIQIAAKENQSLANAFGRSGIYDKNKLLENDIKIVEFSATPDGTIYDLAKWGEHSFQLKMEPGEGYTSCFDLKNQNRVFEYKDLCGYNKVTDTIDDKVKDNINDMLLHNLNTEPLYHIIRTPNEPLSKEVHKNFKKVIGTKANYIKYDKDSDIKDLNNVLKIPPKRNTYIFIKERLRCAKTLVKTHLGIVYERYTKNPDDAVIIQGLIGRGTGYDDNGKSIYFTNITSIDKYEVLWNSNFEDRSVKWKSKTTTSSNKGLNSNKTFNAPSLIEGMSDSSSDFTSDDRDEPIVKEFETQDDAKEYYNNELKAMLKGKGPTKRKANTDGWFETTVCRKKGIFSYDEIYGVRRWNHNETHKFVYHPCYHDVNDQSTLVFVLIYYDKSGVEYTS